jgi:hypothetical protein
MITDEMNRQEDMREWCLEDAHRDLARAYLSHHQRTMPTPSGLNRMPLYHTDHSDERVDEAIKRLIIGSHSGRIGR